MRAAAFVTSMLALGLAISSASADKLAELPQIRSKAAVVIDADTGAEIFAKDADSVRAIASTTKIFVAMAVRHANIDLDAYTKIERSDVRAARGGARTRLDIGESFKNRDLLRAMLMSSDNRAPTALGRAVGLDGDGLVAAMNKVAKRLHLKRTKFTDPSGLRGNVSTAREMALALRLALTDPVLAKYLATRYATVTSESGEITAGRAASCLVDVDVGDQVLVGRDAAEAWVLAVLRRSAPAKATEIALDVTGPDGFVLHGVNPVSEISRELEDLVSHAFGAHHRYPDGFALFTGTMFAPTEDRDRPGDGFTHRVGDVVRISSPRLGALTNVVNTAEDAEDWTFGITALMRNLAARGLLD